MAEHYAGQIQRQGEALISIVVPCYNEEEVFPLLREALKGIADELEAEFAVEIVLIDDGSRDGTWAQIRSLSAEDERVRGVALSRNFGHQMALTCGYDLARGDAIICMDADLQDPPEIALEMVQKWKEGADVVYAIRTAREGETRLKLWTASAFYRLIRFMAATKIEGNSGDFRLLSRRAWEALSRMREHHRFIRGMVGWIGFQTAEIRYERKPRAAGKTKYPLRKMLRLGIDATVSFSIFPLRMTYIFAGLLSLLILSYLAYSFSQYMFFGVELVPGWSSLLLSIMAFGSLNLVCVGIMGEYIGRIYEQGKNRPLYLIRELTSASEDTQARTYVIPSQRATTETAPRHDRGVRPKKGDTDRVQSDR